MTTSHNAADLVNKVRVYIGDDHYKASYLLGFIMGLMHDDPKLTVQDAITEFLINNTRLLDPPCDHGNANAPVCKHGLDIRVYK